MKSKPDKKSAAALDKANAADAAAAKRARADQAKKPVWPAPGTATVTVPATGAAKARAGTLPVSIAGPKAKRATAAGKVTVRVLDRKAAKAAGIGAGVLLTASADQAGAARLAVDYQSFGIGGAAFAGRLRLVELPACALTTPEKPACRAQSEIASTNNRAKHQVTGGITLTGGESDPAPVLSPSTDAAVGDAPLMRESTVLAVTAGASSAQGNYTATPLAASSTWEAGGSSGNFTWNSPLAAPAPAAGPKPELALSYNSADVDGRTSNTNNQSSMVGEGFDLTESYIERKYHSCDDDGQDGKYDLCWKYTNASLVLNGKASELVKDDTTGEWRLENDDDSKVEHLTDTTLGNGDSSGEYWRITTGDGTQYTFGLHKLPGAPDGERTNSVWTVPVFGDDEGEPGYDGGTSFAGRADIQAWRWNLDLVQDTHDNAMTYWYTAEHNNYAKNGVDSPGTDYIRGGYLKEIRYGQRAATLFSATPAASHKVTFGVAERCLASGTGCDTLDEAHRTNWPDVPFDAICNDGKACTGITSPAFFTRKRLTYVNTYFWNTKLATPGFDQVDSYKLKHLYLDPGEVGDSSDQSLWLDELQHVGTHGAGADVTLPPVKFSHQMLTNRVDGAADDILPLGKPRLNTIVTESGQQTTVNYLPAECTATMTKPAEDNNTKRCYPINWAPNGGSTTQLDWFQKYPVSSVRTTSAYGGTLAVQHNYAYSGGGAWHYNDDPMTPEKERTWSIWRGYEKVTHTVGDDTGPQSKDVTIYMRGMHGDKQKDGTTRTVSVTGIKAGAATDYNRLAGFVREKVTYNGADPVTDTVNSVWSKLTATQHKSYADTEAYMVRTAATHTHTYITSGVSPTYRIRRVYNTFDDHGMTTQVEDQGDDAATGDETCTRTWYARNTTLGITSLVGRTQKVAKACTVAQADLDLPTDDSRPGDVISDVATAYDTTTWSATQTPTKGEARWNGRVVGYTTADTPTWQKVSTSTYDSLGRTLTEQDATGATISTTVYTPTAVGPLAQTEVTNAKGHKATMVADGRGMPIKTTDPNSKITEQAYDALGRLTEVWLPNRSRALGKSGNYRFGYSLSNTGPSWLSTTTLGLTQDRTSYEIFDAMLRPRQTQAPSPAEAGGRIITETIYDDRGLAVETNSDLWDTTAPSGTLVATVGGSAPLHTETSYDGAGRATQLVTKTYSTTRWTTTSNYTGDTTTTTAPAGGNATTVVTNALGQTTESRQYPNPTATGTPAVTKFSYTPVGQPNTIVGPDDKTWSYSYDLAGRKTKDTDPDKGTSDTTYTNLDQLATTKDAEGKTLLYGYDVLGRKTDQWQTDKTDPNKLAHWDYDTVTGAAGQPASATRYEGGAGTTGKAYTTKITSYDSLYQPLASELQLPAGDPLVDAGVPQTLKQTTSYNVDGTVQGASEPAVAHLAAENLTYTYNPLGLLDTARGTTGYLLDTTYTTTGQLEQQTLGTDSAGKKTYVANQYEAGTNRLQESDVTDDTHGYMLQDLKYSYDDAGNVTAISDAATWQGTSQADHQCFTYDGHRRLAEAWTPKTADCATSGRTTANLGGAAPYWSSYTYNTAGQRKTETQHTTVGDTATTYTYGTTTGQPHPLTKTETTAPGGGTPSTNSYAYDKTGNTTTRPGTQATQTLTWNSEGKLAQTSEPAAGGKPATSTKYRYDADGNLLIRHPGTTDGETVLYFGATEVHLTVTNSGSTKSLAGTRYYSGGAIRTATSTTNAVTFQAGDHHGTMSLAIKTDDAQTPLRRYTSPFGGPRGTKPTGWPDDKTFLGKPADDTTGLTHIGAREYDPKLGQFISVDPVLSPDQAQSLNGYSYANQNPTTASDPTGLKSVCVEEGDCGPQDPNGDGVVDHPTVHCPSLTIPMCNSGTHSGGGGGGGGGGGSGGSGPSAVKPIDIPKDVIDAMVDPKHGYTDALGTKWCIFGLDTELGCVKGETARKVAWEQVKDISGYTDLVKCTKGSWSGCGWTVVNGIGYITIAGKAVFAIRGAREVSAVEKLALVGCKCFLAGTDVLMADGSTKDIEDIRLGDKVMARDPETGEEGAREVTRLIVTDGDKDFNKLSIATEDGIKPLTATHEHPFWSPSEQRWTRAADLRPGMTLLTDDEKTVVVTANKSFTKHTRTYNLTIEDLHTYYVLAGETPVLVHNSTPCTPAIGPQRPTGVGDDWVARAADNGKGSVWQKSGSTGNADMLRVMNPTGRYPDGYVRFTNKHGQPIGLDGKPGSKADTHIPMNPDGTYPLPVGW
ncbi:polymorphic toxin-type HINT domain-containing protein [Streptomyces sp. NPDC056656]|uniref:polymorphic toxin-type HINT domain-containing protein n=1 Tax=Streptomyces sp. NPDC056656 TaxID=3345895 RepID=UPI00368EBA8A